MRQTLLERLDQMSAEHIAGRLARNHADGQFRIKDAFRRGETLIHRNILLTDNATR